MPSWKVEFTATDSLSVLLFKTSMNTKKKNNNQSLRVTQRQDINSFFFICACSGRVFASWRLSKTIKDWRKWCKCWISYCARPSWLWTHGSGLLNSGEQNYSGNSDDNELNKLDIASNISPTKVIDDSPLDLPIQSNSVRSVEQDLLAGINNYSLGDS